MVSIVVLIANSSTFPLSMKSNQPRRLNLSKVIDRPDISIFHISYPRRGKRWLFLVLLTHPLIMQS